MITTNKNLNYEFKKIGRCETKFDKQIQLRYVLNLNLFLDGLFKKKMGGRGRGRGGGGRGGISWIKKEEPKFIRDFKERVAYKEQANLESKVCVPSRSTLICSFIQIVNLIFRKRIRMIKT